MKQIEPNALTCAWILSSMSNFATKCYAGMAGDVNPAGCQNLEVTTEKFGASRAMTQEIT